MGNTSIFTLNFFATLAFSVIRVSTPIIYAAMGGLIAGRAGLTNLAIEGTMLTAALIGVLVNSFTGSVWLGFLGAICGGLLISGFLAYAAIKLKSNLVLTCIATNMMAAGGTVFIMFLACGDKGLSTSLKSGVLPSIDIPLIKNIPILGDIISGHNIATYLAFLTVIFVYYLINKTAIGLRIRAVGENPHAAESVGVNVNKIKTIALLLSGLFSSMGGAYMSMGYVSWFARDMISGRGFIGLSAMNLGNMTPEGSLLAALIFGFSDALSNVMQSFKIPVEFVQMLPYAATIVGLVFYSIRNEKKKKTNAAKRLEKEVPPKAY